MASSRPPSDLLVDPRRLAAGCGLLSAAVGVVVLIGWTIGFTALEAVLPGWPTMKVNTALGLVALGLALAAVATGRLRAGQAAAAIAIAIGAVTLAEYATGMSFGIDELLFQDHGSATGTTAPGRMALLTSAVFILVGLVVMTWTKPTRAALVATVVASFVALFNLSFFLLGTLPPVGNTRMAVHTSIAFLMMCIGVLLGRGGEAARLMLGRGTTSSLARRVLLPVLALPLLTGWAVRQAGTLHLLDEVQQAAAALFADLVVLAILASFALRRLARETETREAAQAEERRTTAALAEEAKRTAKAEAALRTSSQRLDAIVRNSPVGILLTRVSGGVIEANPAAEKLWGYSRAELLDPSFKTSQLYADPGERAGLIATIQREGGVHDLELKMRRKDGTVRRMLLNNQVTDLGGEAVIVSATRDITELRVAQEALAEAEAAQRAILDNATDAIITGDRRALISGWNRAAERIFGATSEEMIGQSIARLLTPEQWADYQADMAAFMRGQPSKYLGRPREMRAVRKDGTPFDLELSLAVWTGNRGPMFTGVVRDVSARKAAEAAAQEARQRFESVFRVSPVAICLTKEDGRFIDVNDAYCRLVGRSREELMTTGNATDVWEDPDERGNMLQDIRQRGVVRDLELRVQRPDGEVRTTLASIEFIDLGGDTAILSILQDITDRQKAQSERQQRLVNEAELERLRRTDQFRMEFINSTAHELRTPLTPLALALAAVRRDPEVQQATRHLATMQRAVDRLTHVVADMVAAADLQARAISLDRQRLDLTRQLRAAVAGHVESAHRANLELEEPHANGLSVLADELRLQLVMGHLLGNAIKFTPAGGRITVSARKDGDHARIEVSDTGIGMTSKQMEQLWRPYAQAHDKSQRTDSGSGLGLYVTKGIIELHKGEVGCSSPGPGKGSTFWFSLPLAPGSVDPLAKTHRSIPALAMDDGTSSSDAGEGI